MKMTKLIIETFARILITLVTIYITGNLLIEQGKYTKVITLIGIILITWIIIPTIELYKEIIQEERIKRKIKREIENSEKLKKLEKELKKLEKELKGKLEKKC